ncbi:site-2 protease family protein [Methanocella sp. CWC-04]|uniref:Site-2 protease family protein n=1 Tax=Methanooceanicella nereidis TaxID=2052831 RepID=A0AAP2RBW0_9EURY|nr:site-2 protease family protein [Methanocella sp. CWC-04]MCD1293432.1 site-2 protease family protein [Methanocella sp. CWC-04]
MIQKEDIEVIRPVFNIYEISDKERTSILYGEPLADSNVIYGALYGHFSKKNKAIALDYRLGEFVLVIADKKKDNIWINVALAIATVITTMVVGALMYGVDIFSTPWLVYKGLPFSIAIMTVLGSHELGHYFVSKKNGIDSTLPYFIPFPVPPIGTMGAIIRQKGPVPNRKALFDVGISGPLVGLAVSVIITAIGLMLPPVAPAQVAEDVMYMQLQTPIMFDLIASVVNPGAQIESIHPIAFAGWVGMLVTVLNMIPVGQLDGGHVIRAILGERSDRISKLVPLVIMSFGLYSTFVMNQQGQIWIFWGLLTALMGSGMHPKPIDDDNPIGISRTVIAVIGFVLTIMCFTPFPITV